MTNTLKGYLLGAIAAASYGTNPIFAIPLYQDGMDANSVLFFRYLVAIPIVAIMMLARGRSFRLQRKEALPTLIFGLLMGISSLSLFISYNYMGAGIASTLLFIYPILVAVIMALFFKERAGIITILCICIAVLGILLLYRTEDGGTLSTLGLILVFVSALSYAVYLVGINQSVLKDTPTLTLTLYVLIVGLLLFTGYSFANTGIRLPNHWYSWLNIFGVALFPTAISFLCTTAAIAHIGSTKTAILGALEPVAAVLLGIIILGETFTARMALGFLLIIIAVSVIITGNRVSQPLIRMRKLFPKKKTRPIIKPSAEDEKTVTL